MRVWRDGRFVGLGCEVLSEPVNEASLMISFCPHAPQ
jgi:hypothetical protein